MDAIRRCLYTLSPAEQWECLQEPQISTVDMPLKAAITPTPSRTKRVLWDQFHSINYPPAYLPRDNLDVRTDILDWHGDHLLTNYHTLYTFLRENGMFIEILSSPYTCFNASQYAVMIVADSEEEFYAEEVTKLANVRVFCAPLRPTNISFGFIDCDILPHTSRESCCTSSCTGVVAFVLSSWRNACCAQGVDMACLAKKASFGACTQQSLKAER